MAPCVSCPGAALERQQLYRQMVSERFLPNWDKVVLAEAIDVGGEAMAWGVGPKIGRGVVKQRDGVATESGKSDGPVAAKMQSGTSPGKLDDGSERPLHQRGG